MANIQSGLQFSMLSVVVPIYNEAPALPATLSSLIPFCQERDWRIILVNDGSRDDTKQILEAFGNQPGVKILYHKLNRGYGGAIKTGILAAETSYVVTIDADGQHQIDDIESLFNYACDTDADMVVGDRGKSTSGWFREAGKSLIRAFTRLLMPLPIHDLNSGFKLYRTDLAKRYIHLCPDAMAFSDVITLIFINQRHLVLEHPITVHERKSGKSTINTYTAFETIIEILNLVMLFNPLRVFLPLSVVCIVVGLAWGTPFILLGKGVSVGSMLAIVVGVLFFFLGLIASQLSAIRLGGLAKNDRLELK
jgi:glycosyltransferase involved in cell wall biosynthesis